MQKGKLGFGKYVSAKVENVKTKELDVLVDEMDIEDMLLKPSDLALDTGIWRSFPVPNCSDCEGICCAQKLDLRLYDIARFMDHGLDEYIEGTFESFAEYYVEGNDVKQPFPYIAPSDGLINCPFLNEKHKCGIYEARMSSCRAFPLGITKGEDGNMSLQWFGDQCNISFDESRFWKLVNNAILNWNEGMKNQLLLLDARDQLRDMGFDKYLGDENRYKTNT